MGRWMFSQGTAVWAIACKARLPRAAAGSSHCRHAPPSCEHPPARDAQQRLGVAREHLHHRAALGRVVGGGGEQQNLREWLAEASASAWCSIMQVSPAPSKAVRQGHTCPPRMPPCLALKVRYGVAAPLVKVAAGLQAGMDVLKGAENKAVGTLASGGLVSAVRSSLPTVQLPCQTQVDAGRGSDLAACSAALGAERPAAAAGRPAAAGPPPPGTTIAAWAAMPPHLGEVQHVAGATVGHLGTARIGLVQVLQGRQQELVGAVAGASRGRRAVPAGRGHDRQLGLGRVEHDADALQ